MTGTGSGPADGSCETWQWTPLDCGVDPCGEESACSDCVDRSGCGWCDSSDDCHAGSFLGPREGSCDDWDWVSWTCDNTDVCSAHTRCEACAGDAGCGWCASDRTCQTGTGSGPEEGACGDWRFDVPSCSESDPCTVASDCEDCTGRGSCGWCGDSGSCHTGSSTGPSSGACSDWNWVRSECSSAADCESVATCSACIDADGCGFCDSADTCRAGSFFGPESGDCDDWDWYSWTCDNTDACGTSTNCGDCTGRGTCGWCHSSDECMTGSSGGPTDDTCSDWDWLGSAC